MLKNRVVAAILVMAGLLVALWLCLPGLFGALETWGWSEATCTIEESAATEGAESWGVTLRYDVETGQDSRDGTAFGLEEPVFGTREEALAFVSMLAPGARVPCWVEPVKDGRIVLQRGGSWYGILGFFAVFLVSGGMSRLGKAPVGALRLDSQRAARALNANIGVTALFACLFTPLVIIGGGEWSFSVLPTLLLIGAITVGLVMLAVFRLRLPLPPRIRLSAAGALQEGEEAELAWTAGSRAARCEVSLVGVLVERKNERVRRTEASRHVLLTLELHGASGQETVRLPSWLRADLEHRIELHITDQQGNESTVSEPVEIRLTRS